MSIETRETAIVLIKQHQESILNLVKDLIAESNELEVDNIWLRGEVNDLLKQERI